MPNCFFYRTSCSPVRFMPLLDEAVERHIVQFGVTQFVVGQYGDFDRYAARSVKKARNRILK